MPTPAKSRPRAGREVPARRRRVPPRAARHRGVAPPLDRAEPDRPAGHGGRSRRAVRRGPRRGGDLRPLVAERPARAAARDLVAALEGGGRVFFTGCGATGRLSIQLDVDLARLLAGSPRARARDPAARRLGGPGARASWRAATTRSSSRSRGSRTSRRSAASRSPTSACRRATWCSRSPRAVRRPSSSAPPGRGSRPGARVFFVYNNPDDVLRAHVRRSREVIDEPRIRKVNLTTGPMAITGSTRMQATSIELLAMLTVLEMALRELLAEAGPLERRRPVGRRARGDAGGLRARPRRARGRAPARRARAPRRGRGAGLPRGGADLLLRRLPRRSTC